MLTTHKIPQIASNHIVRESDVELIAIALIAANGSTTTLEIKNHFYAAGFNVSQGFVSTAMNNLFVLGRFKYTDNGTYRTYSPAQTYTSPSNGSSIVVTAKDWSRKRKGDYRVAHPSSRLVRYYTPKTGIPTTSFLDAIAEDYKKIAKVKSAIPASYITKV